MVLAHTQGSWWLLPTAGALAGAAFSLTELEESRAAPRLLAIEALSGPSSWNDDERFPHREAALRQLQAAEAMTTEVASRLFLVADDGLPWWKPP